MPLGQPPKRKIMVIKSAENTVFVCHVHVILQLPDGYHSGTSSLLLGRRIRHGCVLQLGESTVHLGGRDGQDAPCEGYTHPDTTSDDATIRAYPPRPDIPDLDGRPFADRDQRPGASREYLRILHGPTQLGEWRRGTARSDRTALVPRNADPRGVHRQPAVKFTKTSCLLTKE